MATPGPMRRQQLSKRIRVLEKALGRKEMPALFFRRKSTLVKYYKKLVAEKAQSGKKQ